MATTDRDPEDLAAPPCHPGGVVSLVAAGIADSPRSVIWHPDYYMDEWIESDVVLSLDWMR